MNKIDLLKERRASLLKRGKETREKIAAIVDGKSFVELSSYSFSKSDFYAEEEQGEGVITGFATLEGNPCYVIATNAKAFSGGISKANCDKIVKTLTEAENNGTAVIYVLETKGVRIGEGINVLEGMADVLYKVNALRGVVPQFAIIDGEVYGTFAAIPSACDFTFYTKNACVAFTSPAVIAASQKNVVAKEEIGGVKSLEYNGSNASVVETVAEAKAKIAKILDIIPCTGVCVTDCEDDLNRTAPSLNEKVCAECLKNAVFDKDSVIEVGEAFVKEVKTVLGRIGGISVGAVIFDGGEDGVEITSSVMKKIKRFATMLADYDIPMVNFVNAKGIQKTFTQAQSDVLTEISNYVYNTTDLRKASIIYGKAVGLGYTLFAAKEMGYDFSAAFATAKVSLFDSREGAYVEYKDVNVTNEEKFAEIYADENQDPINAAKNGYIDNVIEPQFVRQYLIASLQMLVR